MSQMLEVSQISNILEECLRSLDALGLITAAAFVDSAIHSIMSKGEAEFGGTTAPGISKLIYRDEVDFGELDRLADIYFPDLTH